MESFYANAGRVTTESRGGMQNARPPEFRLRHWLFFFFLFFCWWAPGAFCSKSVRATRPLTNRTFELWHLRGAALLIFNETCMYAHCKKFGWWWWFVSIQADCLRTFDAIKRQSYAVWCCTSTQIIHARTPYNIYAPRAWWFFSRTWNVMDFWWYARANFQVLWPLIICMPAPARIFNKSHLTIGPLASIVRS